jgi:NAD(P)-dependent dehydrogenase (short-subunit alcohol dehydrogenase family)
MTNTSRGLAVVSGAGSGIGYGVAQDLAALGYQVLGLDLTAPKTPLCGIDLQIGDVTDWEWVQRVIASAVDRFGPVTALVPAAGIADIVGNRLLPDPGKGRPILKVNIDGTLNLVYAAWPSMVAAKRGAVVLVSSIAAVRGSRVVPVEYSASKGAIEAMVKHLSLTGGPDGIRVNGVAPGTIQTPMSDAFGTPAVDAIPLGRIGTAAEVAAVVSFLLSDAAAFVSGTVVGVNGGMR